MNAGVMPGKDINRFLRYSLCVNSIMKTPKDDTHTVDDTVENLEKCICKLCPTFRQNKLADYPPEALFCARGRSRIPSDIKMDRCYCLGCELFISHGLVIDRLCVTR